MKITEIVGRLRDSFTRSEGWARAHVRIKGRDLDRLMLTDDLTELARIAKSREVLSFEIPNPNEVPLHDLLVPVTAFLREHEHTFATLPDIEIDLFLGWTPKRDMESMIVGTDLVNVLARLNATIFFDTYC